VPPRVRLQLAIAAVSRLNCAAHDRSPRRGSVNTTRSSLREKFARHRRSAHELIARFSSSGRTGRHQPARTRRSTRRRVLALPIGKVLQMLTEKARQGQTSAMIALEGAIRAAAKDEDEDLDELERLMRPD
jgi:hypothetical protein